MPEMRFFTPIVTAQDENCPWRPQLCVDRRPRAPPCAGEGGSMARAERKERVVIWGETDIVVFEIFKKFKRLFVAIRNAILNSTPKYSVSIWYSRVFKAFC